jgi:hypothetical protein
MRPITDLSEYLAKDPQDQPAAPKVLFVEFNGKKGAFLVDNIRRIQGTIAGVKDGVDVVQVPAKSPWTLVDASYLELRTSAETHAYRLANMEDYEAQRVQTEYASYEAIQKAKEDLMRPPAPPKQSGVYNRPSQPPERTETTDWDQGLKDLFNEGKDTDGNATTL